MKIFNLNADEWDRTEEREGWRFKDAWVGAHTDAELIGASMYKVEPGNKQGPQGYEEIEALAASAYEPGSAPRGSASGGATTPAARRR